ncbi:hypothetical protein GGX14DRAFT_569578 [Mycena pura]|uniref:Uncharacterized protein n=1 Tax=Mycena pura TaxID=153505 RepID=A0AAD6V759_9AGAR|nr:hypothetical protein GGX14DRAFT_569578 [Mycena pura]
MLKPSRVRTSRWFVLIGRRTLFPPPLIVSLLFSLVGSYASQSAETLGGEPLSAALSALFLPTPTQFSDIGTNRSLRIIWQHTRTQNIIASSCVSHGSRFLAFPRSTDAPADPIRDLPRRCGAGAGSACAVASAAMYQFCCPVEPTDAEERADLTEGAPSACKCAAPNSTPAAVCPRARPAIAAARRPLSAYSVRNTRPPPAARLPPSTVCVRNAQDTARRPPPTRAPRLSRAAPLTSSPPRTQTPPHPPNPVHTAALGAALQALTALAALRTAPDAAGWYETRPHAHVQEAVLTHTTSAPWWYSCTSC